MPRNAGVTTQGAVPQLDAAAASQLLENVFEECNVEPNTVPMEALASYTMYRRERFTLQRSVLVGLLALFLLAPTLFISPRATIQRTGEGERRLPVYAIKVEGLLPVSSVHAALGTHALPVYEAGGGSYTVEPTRNGQLTVEVTLINQQRTTATAEVADVDAVAPAFVRSETDASSVYLYFSDEGVGADLFGAYAVDADGRSIRPTRIDEAAGLVVFPYPETDTDVYVPDRIGNTVHLALTLGEG